jgi:putative Mn2+ efflux pump MntP
MSNILTLLLLACALGSDATSMAVGVGLTGVNRKQISLTSVVIGLFHIIMPLLGLYLGKLFGKIAGDIASWVGAGILILLGFHMLKEACQDDDNEIKPDTINGWRLLVMAMSVSLDAFSVGFSLGTFSQLSIPLTVITLGVVAGVMTAAGFVLGKKMGRIIGEKAAAVGGLVLIFLGVKIVITG